MAKLIFELNEFNSDLLIEAGQTRPNIKNLTEKTRQDFTIEEDYDSDYLEPWSQWVSIHTGKTCEDHKIKHLGDVSNLQFPQVWESSQEDYGVVWGCINSRGPSNSKIKYFPDPWTKSSNTNIATAKPVLNFLRTAVSARSDFTLQKKIRYLLSSLYTLFWLSTSLDSRIVKFFLRNNKSLINTSMIYAIVEYLTFKKFLAKQRDGKTDIFFANMIAHCQHYYWKTENHNRIEMCFDLVEMMLHCAERKYKKIVVFNGLGQEYSGDKEEWHSYVPKGGWETFVKHFLKIDARVEPCMSYDANLHFQTKEKKKEAITKLKSALVQNSGSLFIVEENPFEANKVFIRLGFYGDKESVVALGNTTFKISDHFDLAAVRAGRHCQKSTAFGDINLGVFSAKSTNPEAYKLYCT